MDYIYKLLNLFSIQAVIVYIMALLLTILVLKIYPKLKLMDRPHKYGLTRAPIPYSGGLSIFITVVIASFIFLKIDKSLGGFLIAGTIIVLTGFIDDRISLKPWIRLLAQLAAALILIFSEIGISSINIPFIGLIDFSSVKLSFFNGSIEIYLFSAIFTIFWIIGVTNAMNFIDGVSGLSSGIGFIGSLVIFFLTIRFGIMEQQISQLPVASLSLYLSMACLAFLIFDFPKPKLLMGDTGSTFIGFTLATLAIFSGGKVATAFLVLGLPILDAIWVVLRRLYTRQKFWQGDFLHLHHRLLRLGLSESMVVFVYLAVTSTMGIFAIYFVDSKQKFFMIIAFSLLMIFFALSLVLVPKIRKNKSGK